MLAIAAQIPSPELGSNYFQETNPELLFRECSHYPRSCRNRNRCRGARDRGAHRSQREASPCSCCPATLLSAMSRRVGAAQTTEPKPIIRPGADDLVHAAHLLNDARRADDLAGAGCRARMPSCRRSGVLKAPIVHAMRGKEYIEYDNPYDVGMTGLLGFSSGYYAMRSCDALLCSAPIFRTNSSIRITPRHSGRHPGDQISRRTASPLDSSAT